MSKRRPVSKRSSPVVADQIGDNPRIDTERYVAGLGGSQSKIDREDDPGLRSPVVRHKNQNRRNGPIQIQNLGNE